MGLELHFILEPPCERAIEINHRRMALVEMYRENNAGKLALTTYQHQAARLFYQHLRLLLHLVLHHLPSKGPHLRVLRLQ